MTPEQEALVNEHYQWARTLASHFHRKKGGELEDIESAALLGLVKAAEVFEPERGLSFKTLAGRKITGHMLDAIRARMTASGWTRNGSKWTERVRKTTWPKLRFNGVLTDIDFDPMSPPPDYDYHLWVEEVTKLKLNPRAATIIKRLLAGELQKDIAKSLGYSPARISQIAAKALRQIAAPHPSEEMSEPHT